MGWFVGVGRWVRACVRVCVRVGGCVRAYVGGWEWVCSIVSG